ncbi:DUF4277 domain-containing protein [Parafrankia sp. BMG5.11]|uniref:DUF4277 domain-containing protein n=1 Tax=Parafrankia sp. BMG5.11 TaxID=222540 RepID=UPI001F35413A|nr:MULTISPECIES: DUF4277 domain-containing protein [unclassified Parafrankia]
MVRDLLARLDLVATIDRLCPVRSDARVTHGQVIAMVIANRLTSRPRWSASRTGRVSGRSRRSSGSSRTRSTTTGSAGSWRRSPSRPTPPSARSAPPRSSRSGSRCPRSTGT